MGAAVARAVAPRGPLLVADVDRTSVEKLARDLGGDVVPATCDVTDQSQVDELVEQIDDLESLVCTAGISTSMSSSGRRIFDVNLIGMNRVLAAVEPLLRPGTVAVLFASMSGYRVPERSDLFRILDNPLSPTFFEDLMSVGVDPDLPRFAYPMSKRVVQRTARRLAAPWGTRGARIMSVSPGINDTPMNRSDEAQNPIMADIIVGSPLGRRGTPEEVASVVSFVISQDASFMTGSDVLVDGGMMAVLPEDATGGAADPGQTGAGN